MKNKILLTLTLTTLLLSCNSLSLSEAEAKDILQQSYTNHCVSKLKTNASSFWGNYASMTNTFRTLEQQGLLTLKVSNSKHITGTYQLAETIMTQKARNEYGVNITSKKYGYGTYIVGKTKIVNVVGIAINKEAQTAEVRFTYTLEDTPLMSVATEKNCSKQIKQETVTFTKYDTGWQMNPQKSSRQGWYN